MSKLRRPLLAFAALPLLLSAVACKKQVVTGTPAPAAPPVAAVPVPVPVPNAVRDSVRVADSLRAVAALVPAAPAVVVQNFNYQFLQIKGKVLYENGDDKQEAQVNIRMKRDSIIWASVSKVGFEGVRAVITRDTVVMIDRLHKSYFAGNFKMLKRRYRVPVTFEQLQESLVGNYLAGAGVRDASAAADTPIQTLHHDQDKLAVEQFINREKQRLVKLSVVDERSGSTLTADYGDFKPLRASKDSTEREFPFALLLTVLRTATPNPAADVQPKTLLISLNHKAVTVPEGRIDFPLSIPADYERKQ